MKSLTRLFIVVCACNALALNAFAGPQPPSKGKEVKQVASQLRDWSGFYAGANVGWGWSNIQASQDPFGATAIGDITPNSVTSIADGAFFGIQLGVNAQRNRWVAGLEGDFQVASIEGTGRTIFPSKFNPANSRNVFSASNKIDWLASIRGRVGHTFGETGSTLIYVTGGAAFEDLATKGLINAETAPAVFGQSGVNNFSGVIPGFVVGAGAEVALSSKWTLRAEYLYYDFFGHNSNDIIIEKAAGAGPQGATVKSGSNDMHVVQLSLSYYPFSANEPLPSLKSAPSSGKDVKEVVSPQLRDWSGFYAGANGGWAWSNIRGSQDPFGATAVADVTPNSVNSNAEGAFVGIQLGYNLQRSRWVTGLEGDFQVAGIEGTGRTIFLSKLQPVLSTNVFSASQKIDWLASIRGRVGHTFGETGSTLLYVTGGAAFEDLATKGLINAETAPAVFGQSGTNDFSGVIPGFVVGAGAEVPISSKWTVRAEYLFYDFFGHNSSNIDIRGAATPNNGVLVKSGDNNMHVVQVSLSYWFGK